ncbi:multiple sugar transport system permease protein [Leifsonia sp. 98AMF]|uniref:carbohydrate ABC transporter permease n=1 Tax=unclassified Leifsonia TaxID=2663824 RepID=UPI00087B1545|nr:MULTISPECIES: sugar ABC transporter permease [unclassified Leifsonia]SDH48703.1 multiple sugar transport system permease protein [Leifsonia sp. 197AMF]SDI89037.1 multiple sugar transport system permease protein [Leifsonia sp. 466MF]SDJ91748.1 multiple sugar transport system permease protein [Leifsonia sp. 157MF]SDN92672.1 multiple sugar transport system permease protein [Leifsonia sp. 509MF]SEN13160.1 multiple sugar transport system permease protein [Leifsonia sp. 467MF]
MSNPTIAAPQGPAPADGSPAGRAPAGGRSGRSSRNGGAGDRTPRAPRRRGLERRNRPLWMLLPGGILMLVIIVVPLIVAVVMSTLDLDQYTLQSWLQAPFLGFGNYVEAVTASPLLRSIGISVSFAVIAAVVTLPIGLSAALATQNRFRGRALVRSLFLIPYVLPAFVVGTLWRTMLQPGGVVDSMLGAVGVHPGLWLNGPLSYWSLIIVQLWTSWPFFYLLVVAGLQSVDPEVHEAAAIDGATWWIKLRYVILPYLRGSILLALIIAFLHNINAFTLPFVLFGIPAPQDVDVLPVLTYTTSFQSFRFGLSAAMAICSLVLIAIPLFVYLRAVRLDSGEEAQR